MNPMKNKILTLLLLLSAMGINAQSEIGSFFIETGVKAFGGSEYNNFIGKTGISFNKSKWTNYYDGSVWQESYRNSFSWSVAPRFGTSLGNYFKTGIDFQFYQRIFTKESNYQNFTTGLFFRAYLSDKKIKPFLELSSGLGRSKNMEEQISSGGGEFESVEKLKLFYYSGSVGLSFVISKNLNLSLSAKIQNTVENEIDDKNDGSVSYVISKNEYLEIGPLISIGYIFNKKTK